MAPIPATHLRHRIRPLQVSITVKRLARLRVLVYVLLGTSAVFGAAVLLWKFGSCLRLFTLGRILRDRKPVDTRYIKTWYGWIPQDRYNSRRQVWKDLRSWFRGWFSWDGCDDYNKIWWDSWYVEEDKSLIHDIPTKKWKQKTRPLESETPLLKESPSNISKPKRSAIASTRVAKHVPMFPHAVNPYHSKSRPSKYLTFPFCMKTSAPESNLAPFIDHENANQRLLNEVILSRIAPLVSQGSISGLPVRPAIHNCRRLREWATRLQMGSLQSILPHQSGLLGRPGSPMSDLYSRISAQKSSSSQKSCEIVAAPRSRMITHCDVCGSDSDIPCVSANFQAFNPSPSIIRGITHSYAVRSLPRPIETSNKPETLGRLKILDTERRFLDNVDRSLQWLLNEYQPGHRGFKFPTMPFKLRLLVYTNPCCASTELMRRYGDRRAVEEPLEVIDAQRRKSAIVRQRRVRSASIDSWRAAINNARRQMEVPGVRSLEFFESSAEESPNQVMNPENWMLRRPPQGFGMPTSQKNAYYYGGVERWAKLDDWQAIDGCHNNSNDIWTSLSVPARSKSCYSQPRRSRVDIICS